MSTDHNRLKTKDVIEAIIPPATASTTQRPSASADNAFCTEAYADWVVEHSGSVGRLAVALEIVDSVADDLTDLAEHRAVSSDDVAFYAQLLTEARDTLVTAGNEQLADMDLPVYDVPTDSKPEWEQRDDSEDSSVDESDFTVLTIDRVSKAGNLVAEGAGIGKKHTLVSHGFVGDEVVIRVEGEQSPLHSKIPECGSRTLALPYTSVEEAAEKYGSQTSLLLEPGQVIGGVKPVKDESDPIVCRTPSFANVDVLETEDSIPRDSFLTVEILQVEDRTAVGTIVNTRKKTSKKRKRKRKNRRKKKRKGRQKKRRKASTSSKKRTRRTSRGLTNFRDYKKLRSDLVRGKL